MEESNTVFEFDHPVNLSNIIKVIGVGGGGCNAVNYMYKQGIKDVDFIVCNTDTKALNTSEVKNKIVLGNLGLGAGSKPERARRAAEGQTDEIHEVLLHNTKMLFIAAGMGGGTGTGAAPVIARIAKSIQLENQDPKEILVVAVVNTPFGWEGPKRMEQALKGIEELRQHVDALIITNNDKLRSLGGNMTIPEGFRQANNVLFSAVKGISDLITEAGLVNLDFQDVNTAMEHSGRALMGTGSGRGENRAHDAVVAASTSSLLDDSDISGAENLLLNFFFAEGHEITLDEIEDITSYLRNITANENTVINWGMGIDENITDDELRITLIATCLDGRSEKKTVDTVNREFMTNPAPVQIENNVDAQDLANGLPPTMEPVRVEDLTPTSESVDTTDKEQIRIYTLDDQDMQVDESRVEPDLFQQPTEIETPLPVAETVDMVADNDEVQPFLPPEAGYSTPYITRNEVRPVAPVEPVAQPVAQPVAETFSRPADSAGNLNVDMGVIYDRAERVKHFYELLHNDPNGAQKVEDLTTRQLTGEEPFQALHSSVSEVSGSYIDRQGNLTANNSFLYKGTD